MAPFSQAYPQVHQLDSPGLQGVGLKPPVWQERVWYRRPGRQQTNRPAVVALVDEEAGLLARLIDGKGWPFSCVCSLPLLSQTGNHWAPDALAGTVSASCHRLALGPDHGLQDRHNQQAETWYMRCEPTTAVSRRTHQ
jgi:hypothetical protein